MLSSKIADLKRLVIISPECLIAILLIYFVNEYPGFFANIAIKIKEESNVPDIVSVLPFSFVAVSYHLGMGVIRPGNEEENKILYEWPYYWMLEHRFYGSLIICILCSFSVVWFYLNPTHLGDAVLGGILVAAITISATTIFLLAIAKVTLRKILTLHR